MIKTSIESKVQIQDVINNQVPSFILDENPKFVDFLKQYYISQEYQSGPVDLTENLDVYLKLDNLRPEITGESPELTSDVGNTSTVVNVSSTKGFPDRYGLFKINDEILTYTGITTNSFTGCIRGFSGITNYHQELNKEELVFESSSASSHSTGDKIENLSSLFLKEFFEKTKYSFAPGFEGRSFAKELDVSNFIKEINSFYTSKGTDDSIETLLKVLFGKSGKSINLEEYLVKPSDANFIRREVVVAQAITGDLSKLSGQTIIKNTDDQTRAVISEIEPFTRKGILYYKLNLYVGYDDNTAIEGTFEITPTTKSLDVVLPGSSVITVDSTAGFESSDVIYSGNNVITYKEKSFNQFLGCTGVGSTIYKTDNIYSDKTYYGFEDGDINDPNKKCTFRITGVISDISSVDNNKVSVSENQIIGIKYLGDLIKNPIEKTYKQIFANSWIYNTSVSVDIESISESIILKTDIDKSHFKVGDRIEIISKRTGDIVYPSNETDIPFIANISSDEDGLNNRLQLENFDFSPIPGVLYSIRRKVNKAFSKEVPIQYGNDQIISDIQNLYIEEGEDNYAYVASNGLPSSEFSQSEIYEFENGSKPPRVIDIDQEIYKYKITPNTVSPLQDVDAQTEASSGIKEYTTINFGEEIKFLTGDRVYYNTSEGSETLVGLSTGSYYVSVLPGNKKIKLYTSRSNIGSDLSSVKFREPSSGIGTHNFVLYDHRTNLIKPKKLFKKFNLNPNLKSSQSEKTTPGSTGMLINGVEISNYKTEEKVYFGPLSSISILNSGSNYDVINLPQLSIPSSEGGTDAKIQPVISGKITDIIIDSETSNFDIKEISSINVSGGNGTGGKFDPVLIKKSIELLFDARPFSDGGGISTSTPQLSFIKDHNLFNGQKITYRNETQYANVGIDQSGNGQNDSTLVNEKEYYVKVDNNTTVKLYETLSDYRTQTNPVSFGQTDVYGGIQKFVVGEAANVLSEIRVLDSGSFTNRKLIVSPVGINTLNDTINFKNHNFENGDLIEYRFDTTSIGISTQVGLSTSVNYYVLKENEDSFRICDAGIGGTITDNFEKRKYVKFITSGSGYQYFKYPDITASVNFVSAGNTSYQLSVTPVVKGNIIDAYLYEPGTGYGSEIINFEKTPEIKVKEGKRGQISPIISSGILIGTNIQFSGFDYFSPPDLTLFDPTGSGSGAKLKAVVENGAITNVIIQNSGRGYSNTSRIEITNSGSGAIFDSKVRALSINNVNKIEKNQYQVFSVSDDQSFLDYGISGYYSKLRESFEDYGNLNSPIIGWAYDGNPIYGAFGQSNPNAVASSTKRIESGYELVADNIPNRPSISSFPLGFFIDDYKFTGNGDLDKNNGRFVRTNEFPNGIYAYYATIEENTNKPKFPYFIGDSYRTNTLEENRTLNQNFDLNSSDLLRNTFPYKISELNADYDFIVETNEISKQRTKIESVQSGSVDSISIINSGQNYQVGDKIVFDNSETNGGGVDAKVSLIEGKNITNISQNTISYPQSIVTWETDKKVRVHTGVAHTLNSGDYVSISGISSVIPSPSILKLDGSYYKVTVDSPVVLRLEDEITDTTVGVVTLVSVSNLTDQLEILNEVTIGSDTFTVLNTYPNLNLVKLERDSGSNIFSAGSLITPKNYSFTINEDFEFFNSEKNTSYYFNPHESVGLGTTAGDSYETTFDFGSNTITRSIPMGRIYLEGHKFSTDDKVTLTPDTQTISIQNSYGDLYSFESGEEYYITNESPNTVGIKTHLTTDSKYVSNVNIQVPAGGTTNAIVPSSQAEGIRAGDIITVASGTFVNSGTNSAVLKYGGNLITIDDVYNETAISDSPALVDAVFSRQSSPVFFKTNGDNSDKYLLTHTNENEKADIDKITATVSVSTSHGLTNGDIVKLQVEPNLNVGIGTSTIANVLRNADLTVGINTVDSRVAYIPSTPQTDPWVFTTSPQKHNFKNGDKVIYSHANGEVLRYGSEIFNPGAWNLLATQKNPEMQNAAFYVRVLNETDFTVSETYDDVFKPSVTGSTTLSITNVAGGNSILTNNGHIWTLVNPQIEVVKGNNLVFDLTDTSLSGNVFKIYYDKEFNNEFISVGGTSTFNVSGVGTAGVSTDAKLTVNYSNNFPEKLYYNIESSSGSGINTPDTTVNNYNQISYVDSAYTGSYTVSGIGSTTDVSFDISLREESERGSYTESECRKLEYDTLSSTANGAVKEIDVITGGENYKKLPSITSIDSKVGKAFEGICVSKDIGKINQVEILNDGFEYSSDKTLTPRAFVSPSVVLKNSNTLSGVTVIDGGKNYVTPPTPVLVDFNTRNPISGGLIKLNIDGESITSVDIEVTPHGLASDNELFVEDSSNGISILKVESDDTGTFVCVLNTPIVGFSEESRLQIGDEVYIEGIQKFSSFGDGFNSSDLGYRFFKVTAYDDSQSNDRVTIDVSEYTSNTGIAKTIQDSSGTIINKKNYPVFNVSSQPSVFLVGEDLLVNNDQVDLKVESHTNETDLKVIGTYDLSVNDKLTGKNSGNIANIASIEKTDAKYNVDYSLKKNFGWRSTTGRLNEDYQVTPDNDYYQTLSYSIRSPLTWEEVKSPINSLVHVSGMKNFADTEIISNTDSKSGISTIDTELDVFVDLISNERVDKVNNFDNTRDIDVVNDKSKFLEFENSIFIPYTKAKTNVVLKIDDISSEFSQFESEPLTYRDIFEIEPRRDYRNYIFKLKNGDNTEIQLTKLSIISDFSGESFILEQESLVNVGIGTSHIEGELYGKFELVTTKFEETFLRFIPKDPFNTEYDVKYLEKRFGDSTVGIATTNIGCIDLISSVTGVTTGFGTRTFIDLDVSEHKSVVTDIHLNTLTTNKQNFVRLYVTSDGLNSNIASYYYDSSSLNKSGEPIGIFTSIVESGRLKINYTNTEDTETVIVRSRSIAFDNSSTAEDVYRFSLPNQPPGSERSLIYQSDFVSDNGNASEIDIVTLNKNTFDAVSSIIEVQVTGASEEFNGSAVHEISFVHDGTSTYIQEGPALYATEDISGITTHIGIGTFGSEFVGTDNFIIKFYPFTNSGTIKIRALSECFYTDIDTVNIAPDLQYGSLIESVKTFSYFALEGDRINKTNFVLRSEKNPIFAKTFDPKNTSVLDPDTGVFSIQDHYFSDGEELIYTPRSSFVGVGSTALEITPGNPLPTTVFAVVGEFEFDTFKLSETKHGPAITGFSSTGEGNIHQLAMKKSLSKAVISLDGMIQSPIAFTNINWQLQDNIGGLISTEATTFALSGIQTVNVSDILKIDDEFMRVRSVGLGTTSIGPITGLGTTELVVVDRGVLGTISTSHTDSTSVGVYKGSYNIVGDEIHFIDAPKGNAAISRQENNLVFQTSDFSGRAFLRKDYTDNKIYDDVSNEFNGIGRTFTLSVDGAGQTGIGTTGGSGIVLINGIYQTPSAPNNPNNNFEITENAGISSVVFTGYEDVGGQVGFSKTDVNANQIPRGGIIVSLGSSGGLGYAPLQGAQIDLITDHHAPATWGQSNDGSIDLVVGKFISAVSVEGTLTSSTSIITGIANTSGIATGMEVQNSDNIAYGQKVQTVGPTNTYTATDGQTLFPPSGSISYTAGYIDVYINGSKLGISSFTATNETTVTLDNTVNVDAGDIVTLVAKDRVILDNNLIFGTNIGETTTINFGYRRPLGGSGYFNNPTVTIVEDCLDETGVGQTAVITATVGAGGSAIFNIDTPGLGHADYPQAFVSEPSYSNLEVRGVSRIGYGQTTDTGVGLLMDIEVGAASTSGIGSTAGEVRGFSISRPGYSFRKGDKFTPVGLVTALGLSSPIEQIEFEVVETFDDTFSAWQFGNLDFIDSIKPYQDGFRTRFPLFYQGELFSVQVAEESRMNVENALIVFINGVLQNPGENYFFSGGASFTLSEPAKIDDQISVFFYRGTQGLDDEQVGSVVPTIERGDYVQINDYFDYKGQNPRRVFDYKESDVLETSPYTGVGLYPSDSTFRPVSWLKQKRDLILGGDFIYKTRRSLLAQIYPNTSIIRDVKVGDTELYVENIDMFKFEIDNNSSSTLDDVSLLIVDDASEFVPADISVTRVNNNDELNVTISNQSDTRGYQPSTTFSALVPEPFTTSRSGWPGTVDGKGGQPISETQKYLSLPPQSSASSNTAVINITTDSIGSITNVNIVSAGSGYSGYETTPQVSIPLPTTVHELTPETSVIHGFSGIVTAINASDTSDTTGRIVRFNDSQTNFNSITFTNSLNTSGSDSFDVPDSGGAIFRFKTFDGSLTEIEMINPGTGYAPGDSIVLTHTNLGSSVTLEVEDTLSDSVTSYDRVRAMEFKLQEDYLDQKKLNLNQSNFNSNVANGQLSQGDYVSISHTQLDTEYNGTTYQYATLEVYDPVTERGVKSKITPETLITDEDGQTQSSYDVGNNIYKRSSLPALSFPGNNGVGIGTTNSIDGIYRVESITIDAQTGIITSYAFIEGGQTTISAKLPLDVNESGTFENGTFSWGKITLSSGVTTSYTVSGNTVGIGLTEYPSVQRKSGGLRGTGALYAGPGVAVTSN